MTKKQDITAQIFDKNGRLLAVGKNSYKKTHPLQAKYAEQVGTPEKMFLHAEVEAIIKAQKLGKPHSNHVSRYSKDGSPAMAQPCPICMLAIKKAGIKLVTFTVG